MSDALIVSKEEFECFLINNPKGFVLQIADNSTHLHYSNGYIIATPKDDCDYYIVSNNPELYNKFKCYIEYLQVDKRR